MTREKTNISIVKREKMPKYPEDYLYLSEFNDSRAFDGVVAYVSARLSFSGRVKLISINDVMNRTNVGHIGALGCYEKGSNTAYVVESSEGLSATFKTVVHEVLHSKGLEDGLLMKLVCSIIERILWIGFRRAPEGNGR